MQQCPEVRSLGKCWGPEDKSRSRAATSRGPGFVSQQRQSRSQLSLSPFLGNQTPCYGCMHVVHRCRCSQNTHAYKPKQNGSRKSVNRYFRGPFVTRWKWPISIGLLQYHWWSGCPRQNAKVRHCGFRLLDNVLGENLIWESECVSISTLLIVASVTLFPLEECTHDINPSCQMLLLMPSNYYAWILQVRILLYTEDCLL